MRICKNDITDQLRKLFHANPLRVPEALYQPLLLLEVTDGKPYPLGDFSDMLLVPFYHELRIDTTDVAELSGKRTQSINTKFGLKLLENILEGFGMDPLKLSASWNNSRTLSFSFSNVKRKRISPLELGKILSEEGLLANTDNIFIKKIMENDKSMLAIITDIITSNSFTVSASKKDGSGAEIDIPEIEGYIAGAGIDVAMASTNSSEVTFNRPTPLTFAFCCVELIIDHEGKFRSGDWLNKIKSRSSGMTANKKLTLEELELGAKVILDDNAAQPMLF